MKLNGRKSDEPNICCYKTSSSAHRFCSVTYMSFDWECDFKMTSAIKDPYTANVWVWITNNQGLYITLVRYLNDCRVNDKKPSYLELMKIYGFDDDDETADGICYLHEKLNIDDLDRALMMEMDECEGIDLSAW